MDRNISVPKVFMAEYVAYRESILHGRAEIRNFSSSVEEYFTSERSERVKYLTHEERNFVSLSGYVMFYLSYRHQ